MLYLLFDLAGTVRYQQDQSEPYSTWTAIEPDHPSLPYDKLNLPSGHRLVRDTENKRKECVYCRRHRFKTKRGYPVQTRYKCGACDVALCCSTGYKGRNCMAAFHNEFKVGEPS